jgi:uncharacterized protein (TIGR03000 family)
VAPALPCCRFIIRLPADAKLFVDDVASPQQDRRVRTFDTRGLTAGKTYQHTLRAETVRDGETIVRTAQVSFRGGQTAVVDFGTLADEAVVKLDRPAHVTVKLPEDARLYVGGVLSPLPQGEVRSFATPVLKPERRYSYTIKAEVVRDGRPVVVSREVAIEAGQAVTVDLTDMTAVSTSAAR